MIKVFKNKKGRDKVFKSYDEILNTWDVEYIEEDINTTFGATHCIISGNRVNPQLLMFHGVGDNSALMWVLNIKELSKYFYCIAVDTLGGPGKSIPNDSFNKKTFKQHLWINEIAHYYQLENFNIVGVSNGAVMAFNYAVHEKEKINKVICIEGGMIINPFKTIFLTLGLMFPEILFPTDNNFKKIIAKLMSPNSDSFAKHPELTDHLILLMKNHNQRAMFVHNLEKYNKESSKKVKENLLFLLGDYKIEERKVFLDILIDGDFRHKVIKDAGHGANHEQFDVVNKEIIDFILE